MQKSWKLCPRTIYVMPIFRWLHNRINRMPYNELFAEICLRPKASQRQREDLGMRRCSGIYMFSSASQLLLVYMVQRRCSCGPHPSIRFDTFAPSILCIEHGMNIRVAQEFRWSDKTSDAAYWVAWCHDWVFRCLRLLHQCNTLLCCCCGLVS